MSCTVDRRMEIISAGHTSSASVGRAPPPFSCRPKIDSTDYAGYWDVKTCLASNTAYSNAVGWTDLEGCCWWGRGVLLTRGVCNIGKFNYYMGKRANDTRGEGRYPDVDFCAYPEAPCTEEGEGSEEIRWITGMFEWIERIQSYTTADWDYMSHLKKFVDDGMTDESFVDSVSSIFVRGCHSPDCSSIEVTMSKERKENFKKVLGVFGLPRITSPPTLSPTEVSLTRMPVTPSPARSVLPPAFVILGLTPPPTPVPTIDQPSPSPITMLISIESGSFLVSISWVTALLISMIGLHLWYI